MPAVVVVRWRRPFSITPSLSVGDEDVTRRELNRSGFPSGVSTWRVSVLISMPWPMRLIAMRDLTYVSISAEPSGFTRFVRTDCTYPTRTPMIDMTFHDSSRTSWARAGRTSRSRRPDARTARARIKSTPCETSDFRLQTTEDLDRPSEVCSLKSEVSFETYTPRVHPRTDSGRGRPGGEIGKPGPVSAGN